MSTSLTDALKDPGPHTAESLAARLPDFPLDAIRQALEALAGQGVLQRDEGPDGIATYRYVAPERYAQANRDVIVNPGDRGPRSRQ